MPVVAKAISWGNAERLTVSSSVLAALPKRCTQYRNTAKTDKLTRLCPTDAGMENLQVERLRVRNALGWRPVVWRIGNVRLPRPGPFADPRERDGAFPLRHRSNPVLQLRVGTGLRPALSGGSGRSASRGGWGIRPALSGEGIGAVGRLLVGGSGRQASGGDQAGRPASGGGQGGRPATTRGRHRRIAGTRVDTKEPALKPAQTVTGGWIHNKKPGSCDPG